MTICFTAKNLEIYSQIAISNHRIKDIDYAKRTVTFSAKNYKKGGKKQLITLSFKDFI